MSWDDLGAEIAAEFDPGVDIDWVHAVANRISGVNRWRRRRAPKHHVPMITCVTCKAPAVRTANHQIYCAPKCNPQNAKPRVKFCRTCSAVLGFHKSKYCGTECRKRFTCKRS